jgi:APA family basic amino acid/polyamine antiporter
MPKRYFRRKSLFVTESQEDAVKMPRHMKAWALISMGIGAIIGAGIFVVSGHAAADYAGPAVVLSFMVAAVICLLAGLCYAELSSVIPLSGSSYSYTYVALGEFPGWLIGWLIILQYFAGACTVAVGFSGYLTSVLADFGYALPKVFLSSCFTYNAVSGWQCSAEGINLPAMALIGSVMLLLSRGIRSASLFNNVMVAIKLVTLAIFIVVAVGYVKIDNWIPFIPENTGVFGQYGISGILRGAGLIFFAYNGFDTVCTLSQETIDPQKNIPKGILGSLLISTLVYAITTLVLTGVAHYSTLAVPDPMAVALEATGASFKGLNILIKLAILAALASVVLTQLLAQTRILYAMSHDGLLPPKMSKLNPHTHTPTFNVFLVGAIGMMISGLLPIEVLAQLVCLAVLSILAIVCLSVPVLRHVHPEYPRPFKVPLVPFIPIIGMLCCLGQMFFLPSSTWIQMVSWLALGGLIYFFYGTRHSHLQKLRKD